MSIRQAVVRLCLLTAFSVSPVVAHAQDFGILESAETINKGSVKLRVSPLIMFGKNVEDDEPGVVVRTMSMSSLKRASR